MFIRGVQYKRLRLVFAATILAARKLIDMAPMQGRRVYLGMRKPNDCMTMLVTTRAFRWNPRVAGDKFWPII